VTTRIQALALVASLSLLGACSPEGAGGPGSSTSPAGSGSPDEAAALPPIRFVEGTLEAGIVFDRENGRSEDFYYIEPLTGGAIFFDAEGDGDPDLYLLNGTQVSGQDDVPGGANAFYLNDGQGHFTDATEAAGLGCSGFSVSVAGADYDNDGDCDLFITNFGVPHALMRNDGQGHFEDVFADSGIEARAFIGSSTAFADVDNDGWLDLYIANCLNHSVHNNLVCEVRVSDGSERLRRYCTPKAYQPVPDQLFRNLGDGTFEDVSESSGIAAQPGRSLGVAFADYDSDGDQDLFVACDQSPNQYFENLGGGKFAEQALQAGVALGADGTAQAGMGISTADWTGDGEIDVAVTYFEEEWNGFYVNRGGHRFKESAKRNGTHAAGLNLMGWGLEFLDADLDTDLDVLIANGHLQDDIHRFRTPVAGYEQPNLFYANLGGGEFVNMGAAAGPGLELERVSRGVAVADVDQDGDLDALVANLFGSPNLLINETPRGDNHWLGVRAVGTRSNRSAVGARITVELPGASLVREIHTGQSYQCQSDLTQHFGLGPIERVPAIEVRWPSGARSRHEDVAVDQVIVLVEPEE